MNATKKKFGNWRQKLRQNVLAILGFSGILLMNCGHPQPTLMYIPVDAEILTPPMTKMDNGFKPCGPKVLIDKKEENAMRCMTFKDYQTHKKNDGLLELAQQSLACTINYLNFRYRIETQPCHWWDIKCKAGRRAQVKKLEKEMDCHIDGR